MLGSIGSSSIYQVSSGIGAVKTIHTTQTLYCIGRNNTFFFCFRHCLCSTTAITSECAKSARFVSCFPRRVKETPHTRMLLALYRVNRLGTEQFNKVVCLWNTIHVLELCPPPGVYWSHVRHNAAHCPSAVNVLPTDLLPHWIVRLLLPSQRLNLLSN